MTNLKTGQWVMLVAPENETGLPIGSFGRVDGPRKASQGTYLFSSVVDGKLHDGYLIDQSWVIPLKGLSKDKIKCLKSLYGVTS